MVRVHVRPPFDCRPLRPARDLWQRTGKEARDRPMGGDSRGLPPSRERPPRVSMPRGADSFLLIVKSRADGCPRDVVFSSRSRQAPLLRRAARERGRPGRLLASRLYGRAADALAAAGDEGRGKLRKAPGRRMRPLIRGCPNGATRPPRGGRPRPNRIGRRARDPAK